MEEIAKAIHELETADYRVANRTQDHTNDRLTIQQHYQASLAASNISIAQSLVRLAEIAEAWMKSVITITTPANPAQGIPFAYPPCENCFTRHAVDEVCTIKPGEHRA